MSRNVLWTKRNASLDDGPDVASAFAPVRVLGEGAFGVVLLVRKVQGDAPAGGLHAMKIMDKATVDARVLAAERAVLEAVCGIDSPFLVKLQAAFQSPTRVFMVMEYCPGGNLGVLLREVRLGKAAIRALGAQLAAALRDLHANKVIHRDLKPENVLLRLDGRAAVADFGLSTLCASRAKGGAPAARKAGFAGTVEYAAPERLQKSGGVVTAAVDWWALGAILFEGLAGRTPFAAPTARDLFINVLFRDPAFRGDFDGDPFARDLCEGLLLKDRLARRAPVDDHGFARFRAHAFFNGDFDAHAVAPVRDRLAADVAAFERFSGDEPRCSVAELADRYFDVENGSAAPKPSLATFEMAACVKMDGEEVRERPHRAPRPRDRAFLFCGCLDKASARAPADVVGTALTYDAALGREPPDDAPGCLDPASGLPDFEQAFRDIIDSEGVTVVEGADLPNDPAPARAPGLSEKLADLSGMMFFVCYDQKDDGA